MEHWKENDSIQNVSPHERKHEQFLWIERKFRCKISGKYGCNRFCFLKPNGQQTKYRGTTNSRKESTPIITNRKIGCCYFNAEKHTFKIKWKPKMILANCHILMTWIGHDNIQLTSNRCTKAWSNTDCACSGQHFTVPWFILVDCLEWSHHFAKQLCDNTCNMNKWTLKWWTS